MKQLAWRKFSLRFAFHFFLCVQAIMIHSSYANYLSQCRLFRLLVANKRQIIQLLEILGLVKRKDALIFKKEEKIP